MNAEKETKQELMNIIHQKNLNKTESISMQPQDLKPDNAKNCQERVYQSSTLHRMSKVMRNGANCGQRRQGRGRLLSLLFSRLGFKSFTIITYVGLTSNVKQVQVLIRKNI